MPRGPPPLQSRGRSAEARHRLGQRTVGGGTAGMGAAAAAAAAVTEARRHGGTEARRGRGRVRARVDAWYPHGQGGCVLGSPVVLRHLGLQHLCERQQL